LHLGAIEERDRAISELHASGTQFTCFTGTKVQILTYSSASVVAQDQRTSALGELLRTKERDFAAKLEDLEQTHAAELEEKERLEMDVEEATHDLNCSKDALAKAGFVALQYH
jgi:hypothetical protein